MSEVYEVLEGETPDDLSDMVQRAVDRGMIPAGGISVCMVHREGYGFDTYYIQAVIKPDALFPVAAAIQRALSKKTQARRK